MKEQKQEKIFAYIDAANVHCSMKDLGWKIDYFRLRSWLKNKYHIQKAYLFIGFISKYKELYTMLQEAGFTLVFKETTLDSGGKPKGNCDSDLVLSVVRDFYEKNMHRAVIISGDGDYASTVSFLLSKKALRVVLAPTSEKCSILLKRTGAPITYLREMRNALEMRDKSNARLKRKSPHSGKTKAGSSSS